MKLHTTFRELRKMKINQLWKKEYRSLIKHVGGVHNHGIDEPIRYLMLLDIPGWEDTLLWMISFENTVDLAAICHMYSIWSNRFESYYYKDLDKWYKVKLSLQYALMSLEPVEGKYDRLICYKYKGAE